MREAATIVTGMRIIIMVFYRIADFVTLKVQTFCMKPAPDAINETLKKCMGEDVFLVQRGISIDFLNICPALLKIVIVLYAMT